MELKSDQAEFSASPFYTVNEEYLNQASELIYCKAKIALKNNIKTIKPIGPYKPIQAPL